MYDVEKDVPIPPVGAARKYTSKYPFRTMAVGDSFFVVVPDGEMVRQQRALASAATRQGVKISTRRVEEDGKSGVRVWRKE